jgi:arylsulfatase A-like enzyme
VLLIGIDTLRPDHLSCYGYDKPTSPNLDKLAQEGVLFENVLSPSPWTLPSFATVVTSLYPTQHGANAFGARIKTTFPSLPMMLLKQGYTTAAFVNAPYLYPGCGMSRGFELYDVMPGGLDRSAAGTTADALKWLDSNSGRPFFLFVHYFDPHYPYEPPAAYRGRFGPGEPGPGGPVPEKTFGADILMESRQDRSIDLAKVTEQQWAYVNGLYDGEIAFTDQAVGELIKGLDDRGLRDRTLIVVLSDHGEEFAEHGGFEHGHTLYSELLRVPLIVSLPGAIPGNGRVARQVRLVDVMPTVLDLLGYRPTTHVEGVSLRPLMEGRTELKASNTALLPPDAAYAGAVLYGYEKKCVTLYPWKLIREVKSGKKQLFNLKTDPGETHDLAAESPTALRTLEELIVKTMLDVSETWYVRICGAPGQTFDLGISLAASAVGSSIYLHEFLDDNGDIVGTDPEGEMSVSWTTIKIDSLRLAGSLTLAFKVGPGIVPVKFDLEIDGKDATDRTFIGQNRVVPTKMPFTEKGDRAGPRSLGEPMETPAGPCFLVWHSGSSFEDTARIAFDEETKRALKAVGYFQ